MNERTTNSSASRGKSGWLRLIGGTLLLTAFVLLLMQGYAPPGPAGDVFRNNLEAGIDATPLFYTDLETPHPTD